MQNTTEDLISELTGKVSFENVNFAHAVVEALERKAQYLGFYRRNFNNIDMATF